METTTPISSPTPRTTRGRRLGPLWGAAAALLLVLVSRFVTSDLVIFSTVSQRSCQDGFCVERMHTPDLLFVAGTREVRLGHQAEGKVQGRFYAEHDPFDEYSDVTIDWKDGGVSLSDDAATLTWDADTLARLDD
jgi:hypothetical protein